MAPHIFFQESQYFNPVDVDLTATPKSREVNKHCKLENHYSMCSQKRYIILCKWATFTIATSEFIQQLANWKITKENKQTHMFIRTSTMWGVSINGRTPSIHFRYFRLGFSFASSDKSKATSISFQPRPTSDFPHHVGQTPHRDPYPLVN